MSPARPSFNSRKPAVKARYALRMLRLIQSVHPLLLLIIATTLEVSGDAVLRIGLYNHAGTLRVFFFLGAAALLFGYGLFLNLANNRNSRRKLAFRYLVSKNFRVAKFCARCEAENIKTETPKHQWKFCKDCEVDRKFYNVLSMHHKFESGSATLPVRSAWRAGTPGGCRA